MSGLMLLRLPNKPADEQQSAHTAKAKGELQVLAWFATIRKENANRCSADRADKCKRKDGRLHCTAPGLSEHELLGLPTVGLAVDLLT